MAALAIRRQAPEANEVGTILSMQRQRIERRFTDEEVGAIIQLASRLDDAVTGTPDEGLSLSEVRRIAGELGIAEAAVDEAVARHAVSQKRTRRRLRLRRVWRLILEAHALIYAVAISGIGAIDLVEGGGFDFVQYPAFGWGVLLAWHAGLTWLVGREAQA